MSDRGSRRFPIHLLWRHVGDGAENPAFAGELFGGELGFVAGESVVPPELGQTEIQNLHPAIVAHHDVAGFEIPMDDPVLVCDSQAVDQGDREVEERPEGQSARPGSSRPVVCALDQLDGEEVDSVCFFHRVDGDDVGMVEGGESLGLLLESVKPLGVGREVRGRIFTATLRSSFVSSAR